MNRSTQIGVIGNHEGGLLVTQRAKKYFWGIEGDYGTDWEEIPKPLYDSLIAYETKRKNNERLRLGKLSNTKLS